MSKLYLKPVAVRTNPQGQPLSFTWRGRRRAVSLILKQWRIRTNWWRKETNRRCWRVEAEGGIYDLYQEQTTGEWFLSQVMD